MAERRSPTASRRVTPIGERPVTSRARGDGGTVIAVYGSRADVGVAAVATALALAFRSLGMRDVGLAELDPRLASRTRAGVIRSSANNDNGSEQMSDATDTIAIPGTDAALVKRQDGVWTLARPRQRTTAISDAKSVIMTVDAMRERFPVSVAALGHQVNERTLAAFDTADRIVVITDGAVPSVRGTQRVLRLCRRLNYPDEKMCVVVNRFDAPGSLAVTDISAALRREVYWKIPAGPVPDVAGLAARLLDR
jgi:pilus assembly protein CpaE